MSKMELMLKRKFLSVIEYFRMIIILSIIRLREDELEDSREGGGGGRIIFPTKNSFNNRII